MSHKHGHIKTEARATDVPTCQWQIEANCANPACSGTHDVWAAHAGTSSGAKLLSGVVEVGSERMEGRDIIPDVVMASVEWEKGGGCHHNGGWPRLRVRNTQQLSELEDYI